MAKDETEEGITGLPIPKKKMSPKKRHEFEKKRRAARKERGDDRVGDTFSQHRMTGSRGHGSEYQNSVREEVLSYLLDEGFASDEKSAEAIMGAMSEAWIESIVEAFGFRDFRQSSQPKKATEPKPAPPTVQSSGGAGGKVTVDKQYPATLGGKKGVKSTDDSGTEYFMPNVGVSNMPDYSKAQYKNKWTNKYQNIPSSQGYQNPQSHLSRTGVPRVYPRTANYGIPD
jgi:hypothetical protein